MFKRKTGAALYPLSGQHPIGGPLPLILPLAQEKVLAHQLEHLLPYRELVEMAQRVGLLVALLRSRCPQLLAERQQ